jgi:hypothetical protein
MSESSEHVAEHVAEHPIIVLRARSRPDTIPGRVVVDSAKGDGYIDFKAAFGCWELVVPSSERGPRAILLELTKITGSFTCSSDGSRFHPILLAPVLRTLGATLPIESRDLTRDSTEPSIVDHNAEAVRFASECAKSLDVRVSAYILGDKKARKLIGPVTKATPWGALVTRTKSNQGTAEYIDADDMCERLGTSFGKFNGDPGNAKRLEKFSQPDETHTFRTIVREHAVVLFEWARKRMDAELGKS